MSFFVCLLASGKQHLATHVLFSRTFFVRLYSIMNIISSSLLCHRNCPGSFHFASFIYNSDLKQTNVAAANKQISIQKDSKAK